MNRLEALANAGQSPWLDYIRRGLISSGDLGRAIAQGVRGVTSNPAIFEKAIAGSRDYNAPLAAILAQDPATPTLTLYERLTADDIRGAADALRPLYESTRGGDGFVSLEVPPDVAHDTGKTVEAARRLWTAIGRPNLMVKVPATPEGIPAIEALISGGINVNATLLFSLSDYEAVARAYLRGLDRCADPARVASVASIFVSRVDVEVGRALETLGTEEALGLRNRVAVANARSIYERFEALFGEAAFSAYASKGGRPQRVLWASVGVKDPAVRDTLYVEELVGPGTVSTIPPQTLAAFEDHGVVRGATVREDLAGGRAILDRIRALGIDLNALTQKLQIEGVAAFEEAYERLLATLELKRRRLLQGAEDPHRYALGAGTADVSARLKEWSVAGVGKRIWAADTTVWKSASAKEVKERTGWLNLPESMLEQVEDITSFADAVRGEGVRYVVLLGMGGSSLAAGVLGAIYGPRAGYPELIGLDSTHPEEIGAVAKGIDVKKTLFLVSSKSGTTVEPLSLKSFFWERLRKMGVPPGDRFVAITDPGTPLAEMARSEHFRKLFEATPTVGGRYSALTHFGLVPAALAGVDISQVLHQAWGMAEACAPCVPLEENPGITLGAALGELAAGGRDKLTIYAASRMAPFPVWLEQLVAESTGKDGKGIVPVVGEPLADIPVYGEDRVFVAFTDDGVGSPSLAGHLKALEAAGHPVITVTVPDPADIGQEFFRWEMAVAASGIVLGIDPFDQPDVEMAKSLAREAMAAAPAGNAPPGVETVDVSDVARLKTAVGSWLASARKGDYVGLQAYVSRVAEAELNSLRAELLNRLKIATTLGYGPRFLHSTGQLHKGGPPTGLFLQIVDEPRFDLPVPGQGFTFGQLLGAQAIGDYRALRAKGLRVLRVNVGSEPESGVRSLIEAVRD